MTERRENSVENWITRVVAAFCILGSTGLFWTFGVFVAMPWRQGRLLQLSGSELQIIGIALLIGSAVAWGGLHIVAISDRAENPRIYAAIRILLVMVSLAAVFSGMAWTQAVVLTR